MSQELFISILLGLVAFVGALMVQQLIKIADSVKNIHSDLKVLTNDHSNLKDEVKKIDGRLDLFEIKYAKNGVHK